MTIMPFACLSAFFCFIGLALPQEGRAEAPAASPITWGKTVRVAAAGWGRMIRLADGRWLSVSTLYPSHDTHILQIKASTDSARTWKTVTTLQEPGRRMDNGGLIQLSSGTILLTGRSLEASRRMFCRFSYNCGISIV